MRTGVTTDWSPFDTLNVLVPHHLWAVAQRPASMSLRKSGIRPDFPPSSMRSLSPLAMCRM